MFRVLYITLLILYICMAYSYGFTQDYIKAKGIIGVNSTVSAGEYSVEDLVKLAKQNNIKVLILTDHALARGEYGLWPWRTIIRKVVEKNSILKFSAQRYITLVREINQSYPELVVIPACDVAPFYYWEGNPFKGNLTVHNWSKQLIVIGLKDPANYQNLPLVANNYRAPQYNLDSILFGLWPILFVGLGIFIFSRRKFNYVDSTGKQLGPKSTTYRILGTIITFLGLLFLVNNFPFSVPPEFDQYHGNQGIKPYQRLIDYANLHNAMTFWSSPESETNFNISGVNFNTTAHKDDLLSSYNYTGFAAIYGHKRTLHLPGQDWDRLLMEYCRQKRKNPVWAIGELGFQGPGHIGNIIDYIQTIFLLKGLTQADVLDALRKGKMYAFGYKGKGEIVLDRFTVEDNLTGRVAYMGDELITSGKIDINIEGSYIGSCAGHADIQLIKNGELLKVLDAKELTFKYKLSEDLPEDFAKSYYRLVIKSDCGEIVTNPIFIKSRE